MKPEVNFREDEELKELKIEGQLPVFCQSTSASSPCNLLWTMESPADSVVAKRIFCLHRWLLNGWGAVMSAAVFYKERIHPSMIQSRSLAGDNQVATAVYIQRGFLQKNRRDRS